MTKMTSRGIRNNNPGNIRNSTTKYKGEKHPSADKAFKQFISMAWGYRAMFVLLDCYNKRYGLNSLEKIIKRYAPSNENDTDAYISNVAFLSGIASKHRLDTQKKQDMMPVIVAISRIENGIEPDISEVEEGWKLFTDSFQV